jgi:uncharacterized membrane protein (UPF0127 family)
MNRPRIGGVGLLVAAVALLVSCSSGASSSSAPGTGSSAAGASPPRLTTSDTTVAWTPAPGGRQVLEGFQEVTVHIRQPDGTVRDACLLLASSEAQRERGLMFVTDPALGGHGGMVFAFDRDDQGAFWMKSTLLPLSIAYLDGGGGIVSTDDMAPCPAGTQACPVYKPDGPYRYAIEVPQGRLAEIGLVAGSRLTVGEAGCP